MLENEMRHPEKIDKSRVDDNDPKQSIQLTLQARVGELKEFSPPKQEN
jgi:hypothetical protein